MCINYLFIFLMSFIAGTISLFLLKKITLKHNILIPKGIPLIGGISTGLSFLISCIFGLYLYGRSLQEVKGIVIPSIIMLIFGVIDDWRELSIFTKFLVQIIATSVLIFFGIRTQIVYIGNLLNIIITFVWVIGITNAFNHLDIMDGLAAGIAMVAGLAFFGISLLNGDVKIAMLSLALTGAVFSFLIHNLPPAKIYMGNCGSHFLGFVLAAIALAISYAPLERKVALLSPLLILGFPIFDTAFLIFMRIKQKRPVFKKSNDHLALRFLALGYSKKKVLLFMLLLGLFFSLSGVVLSQTYNPLGIVIITIVILVSLIITYQMSKPR